mmetsp:Transcript_13394/g.34160  ORF Transcript_13394/g.34160 Transcript_13394/m.34160 type:complete len:216 (-) Transcript_13394:944-1591(-)
MELKQVLPFSPIVSFTSQNTKESVKSELAVKHFRQSRVGLDPQVVPRFDDDVSPPADRLHPDVEGLIVIRQSRGRALEHTTPLAVVPHVPPPLAQCDHLDVDPPVVRPVGGLPHCHRDGPLAVVRHTPRLHPLLGVAGELDHLVVVLHCLRVLVDEDPHMIAREVAHHLTRQHRQHRRIAAETDLQFALRPHRVLAADTHHMVAHLLVLDHDRPP